MRHEDLVFEVLLLLAFTFVEFVIIARIFCFVLNIEFVLKYAIVAYLIFLLLEWVSDTEKEK